MRAVGSINFYFVIGAAPCARNEKLHIANGEDTESLASGRWAQNRDFKDRPIDALRVIYGSKAAKLATWVPTLCEWDAEIINEGKQKNKYMFK